MEDNSCKKYPDDLIEDLRSYEQEVDAHNIYYTKFWKKSFQTL